MNDNENKSTLVWQRIVIIAGVFALLISVLVIANYFQLNRFDPVNTEIINSLVDRLNDNPNDEQLRNQIREVDLLARKAYFTNQWQVKAGGYLLLIALAIIVVAYQILDLNKRKQVTKSPDDNFDFFGLQKRAQNGVMFVGITIFLFAGVLMFLTNKQLENRFQNRLEASNSSVEEVNEPLLQSESVVAESTSESIVDNSVELDALKADKSITIAVVEQTKPAEEKVEQQEVVESKSKPSNGISLSKMKQNFTSFRGFGGLGVSHHKNVPTKWDGATGDNILWKSPIPVHGYSSPIIWENKLFLTGANDKVREVYCYNRLNGKLLWQKAVVGIDGSPAAMPKTTDDTGLAASTMATNGKYVFAIFSTGDVAAFTFDGEMVWGVNLGVPKNHYGHSSSLITFNDKLIVQYDQKGNSQVLALNTKTGKKVWSTPRKVKVSWSSPSLINIETNPELILVADPSVVSYNPDTGKENWSIDCVYGEVGPSVAYADGMVFALNEYATLAAIKIGVTPEVVWEGDMYLSDVPSPIAANGLLFVSTSYGSVVCHDALNGDILWEHDFGNNIYASPMLVGDNIYLLDMKGNMNIFKMSRTYEEIGTSKLGQTSVCTPAFADGHIYIRAGKNLYAIGE